MSWVFDDEDQQDPLKMEQDPQQEEDPSNGSGKSPSEIVLFVHTFPAHSTSPSRRDVNGDDSQFAYSVEHATEKNFKDYKYEILKPVTKMYVDLDQAVTLDEWNARSSSWTDLKDRLRTSSEELVFTDGSYPPKGVKTGKYSMHVVWQQRFMSRWDEHGHFDPKAPEYADYLKPLFGQFYDSLDDKVYDKNRRMRLPLSTDPKLGKDTPHVPHSPDTLHKFLINVVVEDDTMVPITFGPSIKHKERGPLRSYRKPISDPRFADIIMKYLENSQLKKDRFHNHNARLPLLFLMIGSGCNEQQWLTIRTQCPSFKTPERALNRFRQEKKERTWGSLIPTLMKWVREDGVAMDESDLLCLHEIEQASDDQKPKRKRSELFLQEEKFEDEQKNEKVPRLDGAEEQFDEEELIVGTITEELKSLEELTHTTVADLVRKLCKDSVIATSAGCIIWNDARHDMGQMGWCVAQSFEQGGLVSVVEQRIGSAFKKYFIKQKKPVEPTEEEKSVNPNAMKWYLADKKYYQLCQKTAVLLGTAPFIKNVLAFLHGDFQEPNGRRKFDRKFNLFPFEKNKAIVLEPAKEGDDYWAPFEVVEVSKEDKVLMTTGYELPKKMDRTKIEELRALIEDISGEHFESIMSYFASTVWGRNNQELFLCLTGSGGNGKGLIMKLMKHALGNMFANMNITQLQEDTQKSAANPELVNLQGKRLISVNEAGGGTRSDGKRVMISTSKICELTGGDDLTVRPLYRAPFDMTVDGHIVLQCMRDIQLSTVGDQGPTRRCKTILLPRVYKEKPDLSKPNERKADPSLKDKAAEPETYEAFMWLLLLEGRKNSFKFVTSDAIEVDSKEAVQVRNPLLEFLKGYVKTDKHTLGQPYILFEDFKEAYFKYYPEGNCTQGVLMQQFEAADIDISWSPSARRQKSYALARLHLKKIMLPAEESAAQVRSSAAAP